MEVDDALTGHAGAGVGRTYGSEGVPLAVQVTELEKITYPNLSFSYLQGN